MTDKPIQVTNSEINQRVEKTVNFLTRYFCNTNGYAYIWLKNKQTGDAQTLCFNVESQAEISAVVKWAMQLNAVEFYDAYFGVNVGKNPCSKNARHKKEDIHEQISIVADIDIRNAAHHKGDAEKYPADSDTAVSFLPVKPTILIDSGGGIHGYWKFETSNKISNTDEGDAAALRGKKFLDVIRGKAGNYAGAVDGVHDLPRILRLPYSFNCKDRNNLKLCTVIYDTENYFTTAQIDEIISQAYFNPADIPAKENFSPPLSDTPKNYEESQDPPEYEFARRLEMLRVIEPAALSDNEWLAVNSAAKNEGLENYIDEWNRRDSARYNEVENKRRLDSLKDPSFNIATLAGIAKRFGYVEGDFKRQWYKDNPQFSNRKSSVKNGAISNKSSRAESDNTPADNDAASEKIINLITRARAAISKRKEASTHYIKKITDFSAENIFSIRTLYAAAICKIYDPHNFTNFQNKLKANKLPLGKFNKLVDRYFEIFQGYISRVNQLEFQQKNPAVKVVNDIAKIFGDSRGFTVPKNFWLHVDSLYGEVEINGKTIETQFAERPFYISNYYRRNDGTFCVDVTTLNSAGKPLTVRQIPLSDLADARKIAPLANEGLPFTSNDARAIVEYIKIFLAANSQILKVTDLHEKLGWAEIDGKDIFISPYSDKFVIDKNNELLKHLRVKGDYQNWLAIVKKVFEQSPVGRIIFSAALASLLLNIIGCRVFVVYLRCKSKAGKSAVFKLAASIFGDYEILKSFNATINSLEGVIADISPFPAIFDERQVAGANFDVSNFVYRAGEGQGRGRCKQDGTQRLIKRWKNIPICNGEERLTESARTQGLHTRTLELNFLGDKILSDDLAQDIHIMFDTQKVFGHGAKIFLEKLQSENLDAMPDDYKSICQKLKEKYPAYVDDHNRYIAAITFGNFLARKYFFDATDADAFNAAMDDAEEIFPLIDTQINLSDEEMEKEFLLGWIAENRLHFEDMQNDGEKLMTPIFGKADGNYIFINTKSLKEALKRAGLSYSKVKDDMFAAGVFVKVDGQDSTQKKVSGVNFRCIKCLR